jgi:CDP-glucose 4,6-dehydratase
LSTFNVNAGGTANLLEAVRVSGISTAVVCVTTDKVYENNESGVPFAETNPLGGYDPYSASKAAAEIIIQSCRKSFFNPDDYGVKHNVQLASARAGNVIGGGDFANDRIIPDCIRAMAAGRTIGVRNPYSTRPFQHVLEPLAAYLMIAQKQYGDRKFAGYYNVGPDDVDCFQTGALVDLYVSKWGEGLKWINKYDGGPHEANFLKLDCSKLKATFGWAPRWNLDEAMDKIVEWSKCWLAGGDVRICMDKHIDEFLSGVK